jgi:endonuclease/exonuclease/phosphatase family metal-dependent hydrolase
MNSSFARFALLSLSLLLVQCVPPEPPAPVDVRVATWNLHDFGTIATDGTRLAELLTPLAPAVVAVQEVTTQAAFDDLLSRLPDHSGYLAPAAASSGGLRMGLVWDTSRVNVHSQTELYTTDSYLFPRPPLEATVDLVEDAAPVASFVVVNVHLKAGATAADEDRRVQALARLQEHIRSLVDAGVDDEVLLAGDFNEPPEDPRFAEAFSPFTSDPALYRALTLEQADAGGFTFLPAHLFFDHMVATAGLDDERDGGTPVVQRYDQTIPDYQSAVSDHLPVVLDLSVRPVP